MVLRAPADLDAAVELLDEQQARHLVRERELRQAQRARGGVVIISHNNDFTTALCPETWVVEKTTMKFLDPIVEATPSG